MPKDVIDLCDDNNDAVSGQYAAPMMTQLSRKRKRREKKDKVRSERNVARGAEAIEIDIDGKVAASGKSKSDERDMSYLQTLGPLRFEFVCALQGHSYHHMQQNPTLKVNNIYKELLEYQLNLPIDSNSSIFVRALETRLDLVRVLITGPEGTPYANGCFLFDIYLNDYPYRAPTVKFLKTGGGKVGFNPNLYNCGKVCLSLLGTWSGPGWIANKSTLLQVLISIQALILVKEPYYNEPGYENSRNSLYGQEQSAKCDKGGRADTLQHAMDAFLKGALHRERFEYPEFAACIERHFCAKADDIHAQLNAWEKDDCSVRIKADSVRKNLRALVEKNKAKNTMNIE